jgi:epoxyqueuosine reductase
MPLSEEIKEKALALGYIKCGIIAAAGFPEYVRRLKKRIEQFPASEGFYNNLMPMAAPPEGARSIIVAAKGYAHYEIPEGIDGRIGKALLFDARIAWSDGAKARAALVAFLEEKGVRAVSGSVPARMAADAAGVGFFGWNNFIYSDVGSYLWIETILVDTALDYDEALTAAEFKRACGESCRKCVDACPTGALSAPFTMNGPMCAAPQIFSPREPSEEMMEKLGVWQYGCDVCQDVCPMNQGKFGGDAVFPRLAEAVEYLSPEKILAMDEDTYKNVILPRFWYSGENGRWKWRANALRAMVNSGGAQYRGLIRDSLDDEDERVRRVARWGCAKLGIR